MMMRSQAQAPAKRPSVRVKISTPPGANGLNDSKLLLEREYVRCANHEPMNAIVNRRTGEPMDEDMMRKTGFLFGSHGHCDPCAQKMIDQIDSSPPLDAQNEFGMLNPNMKRE